jgi:hypothetical protein
MDAERVMFTELHLYDFDGTLFRSPEAPTGWSGQNWWGHQDSLGRPYVPDVPDASWWIAPTVQSARQSIADPQTVAILITGRASSTFARWRVPELLKSQGLNFDYTLLAPTTGNTPAYKRLITERLLAKFPSIQSIGMWEDTKANVDAVRTVVGARDFHWTRVKVPPKEVEYVPDGPDPVKVATRWRSRG